MCSSNASSMDYTPFRFMDLAAEVRVEVYKLYFMSPSDVLLRMPAELAEIYKSLNWQDPQTVKIKDTTLLQVSHQICEEALPVLYVSSTFHYTLRNNVGPWPASFSAHLSMIRHVSIEYLQDHTVIGPTQNQLMEKAMEIMCTQVVAHASVLRTFSLYIIPIPSLARMPRGLMLGATAILSMKFLKTRVERLSLLSLGRLEQIKEFATEISPETDWIHHTWGWLPGFKTQWRPFKIARRRWPDLRKTENAIEAWHTNRWGVTILEPD